MSKFNELYNRLINDEISLIQKIKIINADRSIELAAINNKFNEKIKDAKDSHNQSDVIQEYLIPALQEIANELGLKFDNFDDLSLNTLMESITKFNYIANDNDIDVMPSVIEILKFDIKHGSRTMDDKRFLAIINSVYVNYNKQFIGDSLIGNKLSIPYGLDNNPMMNNNTPNQFGMPNTIPNQFGMPNTTPNQFGMPNTIPNQFGMPNTTPNEGNGYKSFGDFQKQRGLFF